MTANLEKENTTENTTLKESGAVFGGTERETGKMYLVAIYDR
jgi:hypothetical protein